MIRRELTETCNEKPFVAQAYRMSIPPTVENASFKDASAEILSAGLRQMREKNEELFMRVVHLEAQNKRMKEQLKLLVEVEGEVAKRAKEALEMEG